MIPHLTTGHSFKGTINYLANPKRGTEQTDPALRRMVFTANMEAYNPRNAREVIAIMTRHTSEEIRRGLMEAAQVRGRARALNTDKPPVMHLTLAFPGGAKPEPKFVRQTVKEALSALDTFNGKTLADHQYATFLHQDTKHWHVHIVINLIDHRTGRLAHPYRSQQKLQHWAWQWCKRHGFDVCHRRQNKYRAIEKQKQHDKMRNRPYENNSGYINLNGDHYYVHQQKRAAGIFWPMPTQPGTATKAQEIKSWCQTRYYRRRAESNCLCQWHRQQARAIHQDYKPLIKEAMALKANPVPLSPDWWQAKERKQFFENEKTIIGRLCNALSVALIEKARNPYTSIQALFLENIMDSRRRKRVFLQDQYRRRQNFKRVRQLQAQKAQQLNRLKREYSENDNALKNAHASEIAHERSVWKKFNEQRFAKENQRIRDLAHEDEWTIPVKSEIAQPNVSPKKIDKDDARTETEVKGGAHLSLS